MSRSNTNKEIMPKKVKATISKMSTREMLLMLLTCEKSSEPLIQRILVVSILGEWTYVLRHEWSERRPSSDGSR